MLLDGRLGVDNCNVLLWYSQCHLKMMYMNIQIYIYSDDDDGCIYVTMKQITMQYYCSIYFRYINTRIKQTNPPIINVGINQKDDVVVLVVVRDAAGCIEVAVRKN